MAHAKPLPWWSRPASRFNTWLLRLGLRIGTQHVLSVPGRKTGRMRSTPVSLVTLENTRYVVSGEGLAWVANARAAGWGELLRAGRRERIRLTELPVDERRRVLRAFWHQVPHGRPFIARFFGLPADAGPDDFEAGPALSGVSTRHDGSCRWTIVGCLTRAERQVRGPVTSPRSGQRRDTVGRAHGSRRRGRWPRSSSERS
jgi:hypothetical protein